MGGRRTEFWECDNCGDVRFNEEEVTCWECGQGAMIFQEVPDGWMFVWEMEDLRDV